MNKTSDSSQDATGSGKTAAGPSLAERARTLMQVGGQSSLSTMSQKHSGYPFGSVMPYAVDDSGSPIFLISQMAMHTKNLRAEPRATLLVAESSGSLGSARISVMGDVARVADDGLQEIAERYLTQHPASKQWAGFGDFGFYRMSIKDVYFIGGFGVMGWVKADDYRAAQPDPVSDAARDIIEHMNEDHVESMLLLIQTHLDIKANDARMTAVDRYGFNVRLQAEGRSLGGRIGFPETVNTPTEVRKALVAMVKQARNA